jgi:uracil-DNA glycosylase
VQDGVQVPPSLVNIFREIADELGVPVPVGGDLTPWAKQGVLLLNTSLTVREGKAGSHRGQGWEILTDRIIELLAQREQRLVFLLWGANAATKVPIIEAAEARGGKRHLILKSPHPSPLSAHRGFFGNGHFKAANDFLASIGEDPIDWGLK